jgi:sugar-specific transcriptional regulator TrmB
MALHEEPNLSGYEVAKRVSVSRTNVYAVLRSLTEQGICRAIEGDPVLYDAVPIEQLVRALKSDFEKTAQKLLQELKSPPRSSSSFYTWQGEEPLKKTIHRLIANADQHIIADFWSEDVHWVEQPLLGSFTTGLKLSALETDHPAVIELLQNAFYHDVVMEQVERDFGDALVRKYGIGYHKIMDTYRDRF